MSSTGRKKKDGTVTKRVASDFYATPLWCTKSLLAVPEVNEIFENSFTILEPCCGDMAIVQAVDDIFPNKTWITSELRAKEEIKIAAFRHARDMVLEYECPRDFLLDQSYYYYRTDICITNPPFTIWEDFAEKSMTLSDHVFFLLRLGVLGSKKRFEFWQDHKPDIYVLRDRPSFTNDGQTDSDYYGWFHFHVNESGKYRVIQ